MEPTTKSDGSKVSSGTRTLSEELQKLKMKAQEMGEETEDAIGEELLELTTNEIDETLRTVSEIECLAHAWGQIIDSIETARNEHAALREAA